MDAQDSPGAVGAPAVRLLGPAEVRKIAGRLGVRPSKRLGQNFVIEQGTVRKIAALAEVGPDDVVLEVGPGLGSSPSRSTPRWRPSCRSRSRPGPRAWPAE